MTSQPTERGPGTGPRAAGDRALAGLLRQLALGLSAYRLFPGDLEQEGFVAAVERIRQSAREALAEGAVDVEIRGGSFVAADGSDIGDEHVDRLADACYRRRVEHIHLRSVPDAEDLAAVFDALSLPEEEVLERGGAARIAAGQGVHALRLGDVAPEPGSATSVPLAELTAEELDLWRELEDPQRLAAALLEGDLTGDAAEEAAAIYRRFQSLHASLPATLTQLPAFFQNLARAVDLLPAPIRREFGAIAVSKLGSDPFADRYIGDLSDPDLASLLLLVGDGGPDPVELAQRIVVDARRHGGLVDLTRAAVGGPQPSESEAGPVLASFALRPADRPVRDTVTDLMASALLDASQDDLAYLRERFARSLDRQREEALQAFADYLVAESDRDRLVQVVEVWADHVRAAVLARDEREVEELLAAASPAPHLLDEETAELLRAGRDRVVTPELVEDLVGESGEDELAASIALLSRLGQGAVEALLDLLAVEEDRGRRALLVGLLAGLAGSEVERVASRLGDERWYVVRNAATVLGRLGPKPGALAAVVAAAHHDHPAVRREITHTLTAVGGAAAVPHLRRLAADPDSGVSRAAVASLGGLVVPAAARALAEVARVAGDPEVRRRAIDQLARHPAAEAGTELARLAARRGGRPRLPRKLRRHARELSRQRGGSA